MSSMPPTTIKHTDANTPLIESVRLYRLAGEHVHNPAVAECLIRKAIDMLKTCPGDTKKYQWTFTLGLGVCLFSFPDNPSKIKEAKRLLRDAAALAQSIPSSPEWLWPGNRYHHQCKDD